jgi:hypothetical protein
VEREAGVGKPWAFTFSDRAAIAKKATNRTNLINRVIFEMAWEICRAMWLKPSLSQFLIN